MTFHTALTIGKAYKQRVHKQLTGAAKFICRPLTEAAIIGLKLSTIVRENLEFQ